MFVARKIPTIAGTCMEQEIAIMEKLAKGCENLVQLRGVVVASHDAGKSPFVFLMECCQQSLNDHWKREMGLIALDVQRRCLRQVL